MSTSASDPYDHGAAVSTESATPVAEQSAPPVAPAPPAPVVDAPTVAGSEPVNTVTGQIVTPQPTPPAGEVVNASTALTPHLTRYPVFNDNGRAAAVLRKNMGEGGLGEFDLDRIKVPSAGGLAWQWEGLGGTEVAQTIAGVVVHHKDTRAYWTQKFAGGSQPPDCSSPDAIIGQGLYGVGSQANPTGACATCPMSAFGTAINDKGEKAAGQACKQMKVIFLLREGQSLPTVLAVPPTSLKPIKNFFMQLTSGGIPYDGVVTEFSLETDKSATGIIYSKIKPRVAQQLNDAEMEATERFGDTIRASLNTFNASDIYDYAS